VIEPQVPVRGDAEALQVEETAVIQGHQPPGAGGGYCGQVGFADISREPGVLQAEGPPKPAAGIIGGNREQLKPLHPGQDLLGLRQDPQLPGLARLVQDQGTLKSGGPGERPPAGQPLAQLHDPGGEGGDGALLFKAFGQLGVAMPHQVSAGGAGAEDGLGSGKDPEKVAHETPGRGRVPCRPGELAAAGLVLRVFPGNVKAIQEAGHGTGHVRGKLIQKARDEEFDAGSPF
jgi:hypothetical protein